MSKERREHKRANKHFLMKYYEQGKKKDARSTTQLKNISAGGICFVSEEAIEPGTVLWIELKTPYLTDTAYFEGEVLASKENVAGMLYETRLKFENLTDEATFIIEKLMEYFEHEKGHFNE